MVEPRDKAKDLKEGLAYAIKEYKKVRVTSFKQRARRVEKAKKHEKKAEMSTKEAEYWMGY